MSGSLTVLRRLIEESDQRTRRWSRRLSAGAEQRNAVAVGAAQALRSAIGSVGQRIARFAYLPVNNPSIAATALSASEGEMRVLEKEFDRKLPTLAQSLWETLQPGYYEVCNTGDCGAPPCAAVEAVLYRIFPDFAATDKSMCVIVVRDETKASTQRDLAAALEGLVIVTGPGAWAHNAGAEMYQRSSTAFSDYVQDLASYGWFDKESVIGLALTHRREARELRSEFAKEAEMKGIGLAASAILHRVSNTLVNAQYLIDRLPSADDVASFPEAYEDNVRAMSDSLARYRRLEASLTAAVSRLSGAAGPPLGMESRPALTLLEGVQSGFEGHLGRRSTRHSDVQLVMGTERDALSIQFENTRVVVHQYVQEILDIHIDNSVRELLREETRDRRLYVDLRDLGDHVVISLTNKGPPIPADVKQDLDRTSAVRRPHGRGLGVFLSSLLMAELSGEVRFTSPVADALGTKVELFFRKEQS